jgi:uncharacterized protein (TIGR02246 family)
VADDVRRAIEAVNGRFMASFANGDAAAIAGLYTDSAQLLPANADFVTGPSAIRAFWQGALDSRLKGASLETLEVEAHGETAIEVGRYRLLGEGATADSGKYLVVWKNDGGSWKLHRDIWTTSQPAAAAPA